MKGTVSGLLTVLTERLDAVRYFRDSFRLTNETLYKSYSREWIVIDKVLTLINKVNPDEKQLLSLLSSVVYFVGHTEVGVVCTKCVLFIENGEYSLDFMDNGLIEKNIGFPIDIEI